MVQTTLFVNPTAGNDSGNGSQAAPFKTISRALQAAQSGTAIQLAGGTYSAVSGEAFPIKIPSGVTVVGSEANKGSGILISGSGIFPSPTFANQNVTFHLANNAQLKGVTVTNPATRGTGVWVESTNPTIANNTFTNCLREGIFATGTASPLVVGNVAVQNSASGFSIVRNAKGEWRQNVCRQTGFGFAIGDSAAPLLAENQISENRDGIVINKQSKAVLRGNVVQNNTEAGLVVTETALPDLGSSQAPGGNIFRQNGQFDIQNGTTVTLISVGNQVDPTKVQGAIDFVGNEIPTPAPSPSGSPTPAPTPTPTSAPTPTPAPTPGNPAGFSDTQGHWAEPFIQGLVSRGLISGFPDGTFKPEAPITRAQYAAVIAKTFDLPAKQTAKNFSDVPQGFWAADFITKANQMGFISGFPDNTFRPNQNLTRVQSIVSLISGINLSGGALDVLKVYTDRAQIPSYATDMVAIATQRRIIVNHPNLRQLEPMRDISRAEVVAIIYQALVSLNRAPAIASSFIVAPDASLPLFTDIQGHWAANFITGLANQNLISGFEDGSFKPDATMNRAQYAAIIAKAFNPPAKRATTNFTDIPASFWAKPAIDQAYQGGFISGFPDGTFKPNQNVLRLQVWLSLVSGLGLPVGDMSLLNGYDDRNTVPQNAQDEVATATKAKIVVNFPNVRQLNATREATRAEVAAIVYQGLVQAGRAAGISSPYIVSV